MTVLMMKGQKQLGQDFALILNKTFEVYLVGNPTNLKVLSGDSGPKEVKFMIDLRPFAKVIQLSLGKTFFIPKNIMFKSQNKIYIPSRNT